MIFVAGLRLDGLVVPLVFDGRINADCSRRTSNSFRFDLSPGDIVVMDNLSSQKGRRSAR